MLLLVFSLAIGSVSAAKMDAYAIVYHKQGHNEGDACPINKHNKCSIVGKTSVRVFVEDSPSKLKKYSHGRLKIGNNIISKKSTYKSMTAVGKEYFGISHVKNGVGSLNGKTLTFQGYDKNKKKWADLSKIKIKKAYYQRGHGYYG